MQDDKIATARARSYYQALQYLDSTVEVRGGSKVAMIVKRGGSEVCASKGKHCMVDEGKGVGDLYQRPC